MCSVGAWRVLRNLRRACGQRAVVPIIGWAWLLANRSCLPRLGATGCHRNISFCGMLTIL
jgi:hypothetical protein